MERSAKISKYFVKVYLKSGQELNIDYSTISECKEVFQVLHEGLKNKEEAVSIGGNTGIYISYDGVSAIKIFW